MDDRVHPRRDTPPHASAALAAEPAPRSYVVKVPKEQVLRVPPPEAERKFKEYTRRGRRKQGRGGCRRCLCWFTGAVILFLFLLGATAGILYLVYRPKLPRYSIESLSAKGFFPSPGEDSSPEFVATVRAENPNKKIGIDYRGGGTTSISFSGANLCSGEWPARYQGPRSVDVFQSALTGSGVRLSSSISGELQAAQIRGEVPLQIRTKVPVRIRLGALRTWTIKVKLQCAVAVDGLTENLKILSTSCRVRVRIF